MLILYLLMLEKPDNTEAFLEMYYQYLPMLTRITKRYFPNGWLFEDALQMTWEDVAKNFVKVSADDYVYSPLYREWELKLLENPSGYVKKKYRLMRRRALQITAVIVFTLAVAFGAVMSAVPEVSSALKQWFIEHFQTHDSNRFMGETDGQSVGRWYPTYLPDGYIGSEYIDLSGYVVIRFENGNGSYF